MIAYTVLLLATLVAGAPPTPALDTPPLFGMSHPQSSIPISRRIQTSNGTIAEHDRARAAQLYKMGKSVTNGQLLKRQDSLPVTNRVVTYVAEVGVGSPPTNYSLIIDTGSSNTWVGAGKSYVETNTSCPTWQLVEVTYGSGVFGGYEVNDTVTLTNELVIANQSIGVALGSEGFDGFDGILGIGPTDLTEETGKISEKVVGMYFAPTTANNNTNGEMTFGGVDKSKNSSPITFAPITSTSPSNEFFGIDQTITYNNASTMVLNSTAGIVDTGTTLTLLATGAYNTYKNLTGATEDETTGLLQISPENYANLESLFFNIAGTNFEFTKNAQTWPRALNSVIGGSEDDIYLVIADMGSLEGEGLDFINGMAFLQRFYSVYDSTNNRVGLATTAHTFDTTN